MMNDMMNGGIWGTGVTWIIVLVVLVLAGAALVKYLFSKR